MDTTMNNLPDSRIANWDAYSVPFTSVMPQQMLRLNQEVASYMRGDVADFGCGGGKIIPFLLTKDTVSSYTGIDSSKDMIERARWMARQYSPGKAILINNKIEDVSLRHTDSALSINSYYVWPDPMKVLAHIHMQLTTGSCFVLATINSSIDMPALLAEAEKELIAHPHWAEFKQHNLGISASRDINLVDMDTLIGQIRYVGFRVRAAHQSLYNGGLSFVVCDKHGCS